MSVYFIYSQSLDSLQIVVIPSLVMVNFVLPAPQIKLIIYSFNPIGRILIL